MYHIIELENGQPMIFEQSGRQIRSYLIANGRIYTKGYVFKDFKRDFIVYPIGLPLVSYHSVDNSFVLTNVGPNSFNEVLCLKTPYVTTIYNGQLYVFYLDNSLMGVCSDNLTEKHCIAQSIKCSNIISTFVHNNHIFIITDTMIYETDNDFNLISTQASNIFLSDENAAFSSVEKVLKDSNSYNKSNLNDSNSHNKNNLKDSNSYKELVYNYNILKKDIEGLKNKYVQLSNNVGDLQEQVRFLKSN